MTQPHILVVDDEENICFTLKRFLTDQGYRVTETATLDQAKKALATTPFDLVFTDIMLDGESGMDLLKAVGEMAGTCPVVMITGVPSVETAARSVRLGAFDYLPKPVRREDLIRVAAAALRHKTLVDEKERLRTHMSAIFKSVRDGILTVDDQLVITEVNGALENGCGFTREDLVGRSLKDLGKRGCGPCLGLLEETLKHQTPSEIRHLTCRRPGRPYRVVSLSTTPLKAQGRSSTGAVLVIRDETRLATLERDLKQRTGCHKMVGKSSVMQGIYDLIDNLSQVRSTVLVTGESGTGKELVADALHYMGEGQDGPLVKVNCAALSENLLESELFGHVKGAFSGALQDRDGRFKLAHGGTLFLDEIGEISPRMQIALLRVLQEKEFERVGEAVPIKVDVRVVAATNKNLKEEVAQGRFRQDLYYRLKVVEIDLPPLRERRTDIPLLVEYFRREFNAELGRKVSSVSGEAMDLLSRHNWPGNIRELKHVMEHIFILNRVPVVTPEHLPQELQPRTDSGTRDQYLKVLDACRWNKTRAAKALGMSRQNLYKRMKRLGIDTPRS